MHYGIHPQVCIVDELWKNENLPNVRLRDVTEIIDAPEGLRLVAVNGQDIPYMGWIEVTFGLTLNEKKSERTHHTCVGDEGQAALSSYYRIQRD